MSSLAADWIKIYDGADGLSPDFCAKVVRFFEASTDKHKLNVSYQRYHELLNLHQTPLYEEIRANVARIFDHYKRDVGSGTLHFVNRLEVTKIMRYDVGDADGLHHFESHADCWSMESASRQVSIIFYLNDVTVGGETVFDNGTAVEPRLGRALMFPSSLCFQHRGDPPVSNSKYVLTMWLHFDGTGHAYTTRPLYT